ncbi:MAG: diadenylate cyclase CdaA [Oscillospiraceae bacterium]|nr:diadenylate cyclase CdaA [Oscillospiraceae bacterium]
MSVLSTFFEGFLRYVGTFALSDWADITLLSFALYQGLRWLGRTHAANLGRGILLFLLFLALSMVFQLNTINAILRAILTWGIIGLMVIFQPEIRRIFEQLGATKLGSFNPFARVQRTGVLESAIAQTVDACAEMSESHTGMLMVFERIVTLDEIARTGTIVDAQITSQLLKNIFFVKAALHDGAVIVRNGRLYAAGCILPLTHKTNISRDLGTRHRAGIGMSENSDAVVVIVSEETGAISVAIDGQLKRYLTPQTLSKILSNELIPEEDEEKARFTWLRPLLRRFKAESKEKEAEDDGIQ